MESKAKIMEIQKQALANMGAMGLIATSDEELVTVPV
jgi:hypothetical protein